MQPRIRVNKKKISHGFENSQGASKSIQARSGVSPTTPGDHLNGPESILVAWIVRLFLSLSSMLETAPAQPKVYRQRRLFGNI